MKEITPTPDVENRPELLAAFITAIETNSDLSFLHDCNDAEIASLLESVNVPQRIEIIEEISATRYWAILDYLQFETAKHIHLALDEQFAQERLGFVTENEVINFAEFLPSEFVDEFLLTQSTATVAHIKQALSFEDDEVGRYAESCFLVANAHNSVGKIKDELKKHTENPIRIIVVKDSTGIIGVIPTDTLLLNDNGVKLKSIAVFSPILDGNQEINEVSNQLSIDGTTLWFPVVSQGTVVGVISMSTIALTLRENSLQAVVQENVKSEEDLFTPLTVAARLRALWLVINLLTAFVASAIIGVFDNVVEQVVALAILMPVVASMGGIAGSQTLAVALRGIALNHLHQSNLKLLVNKELKIAAINGIIMAAVIGFVVYLVFQSPALGVIIGCAIVVNSLAAAASGTLIPFTLKKLNIDPAVAGSVVLTTVTDVVGFLVFLGLGAIFLV